jgi:hypothetical protein
MNPLLRRILSPFLGARPVSPRNTCVGLWGQTASILNIDIRRCLVHRRIPAAIVIDIIAQLKKVRLHDTRSSVERLHALFCTILLHYVFKIRCLGLNVIHTWFALRLTKARGSQVIVLLQNPLILTSSTPRGR